MRTGNQIESRWIGRLLGSLLFLIMICVVSDCHAQRKRGLFRGGLFKHHSKHQATPRPELSEEAPVVRQHDSPRHFFGKTGEHSIFKAPRYPDGWDPFPKYIGGFHSSHFSNLGVPSGDLGFRGNGIYWAPW